MAAGVTQPNFSRLLSGTTSARSKAYARLCIYVSRRPASVSTREINENEDITEAIATVWDGTKEQARILANIIRSLSPLTSTNCREGR